MNEVSSVSSSGPTSRHVRIGLAGGAICIAVPEPLHARYVATFLRGNRREEKSLRFVTLLALMEAAYKQGWREGHASVRRRSGESVDSAE